MPVRFAILVCVLSATASADLPPERQQSLRDLIRQDCGSCHGMTLQGGLGSALTPQALSGKSPALLVDIIINGRPGTPMPPWKGLLSIKEAGWIVEELQKGLPQ